MACAYRGINEKAIEKTENPQKRKSNTKVENAEKTLIKKSPCKKKITGHKRKITMVDKTDFVNRKNQRQNKISHRDRKKFSGK